MIESPTNSPDNHKLNSNEIDSLVDFKLPLVMRDYERFDEHSHQDRERIFKLRELEVTVLSLASVFLLTQTPISWVAIIPFYFFIIAFIVIEARVTADLVTRAQGMLKIEEKLQETDIEKLKESIATWTFGATRAKRRGLGRRYIYLTTLKVIFKPSSIIWHGSLALVISIIFAIVT